MPYPVELDNMVRAITEDPKALAIYDVVTSNGRAGQKCTYYPPLLKELARRGIGTNDRVGMNERLCKLSHAGLLEIGWYSESADMFFVERAESLVESEFWSRSFRSTDDTLLHTKLDLYRKLNDPSYVKQQTLAD
ncbi:MAG: hypothetical protein NT016_01335 [Candidatus Aenigmarchaeota archaeon]|nr:hypothetical protein [Candidatus Aenigmarchaeota archaeon]